ncbi:MAG: LPS export ABC transporter periplasmic protein LptC [Bacteroidales bacterium]|jgi:LPS export ABC transporter protein LptC|nr:LPS export ABC transporter periplasmic protein LptC [Bacteroidales bacterium]
MLRRIILFPLLIFTLLSCIFAACSGKKEELLSLSDPKKLPQIATYGITTLISDSGIVRYRINTDEWLMYPNDGQPYWYFPKGAYVEQLDSTAKAQLYVKCDTAYFYEIKQLWWLIGNVHIEMLDGQKKYDLDDLFWDQRKGKIYSDKSARTEQNGIVMYGVGFDMEQSMKKGVIRRIKGTFPLDETPSDTLRMKPASNTLHSTPRDTLKK